MFLLLVLFYFILLLLLSNFFEYGIDYIGENIQASSMGPIIHNYGL